MKFRKNNKDQLKSNFKDSSGRSCSLQESRDSAIWLGVSTNRMKINCTLAKLILNAIDKQEKLHFEDLHFRKCSVIPSKKYIYLGVNTSKMSLDADLQQVIKIILSFFVKNGFLSQEAIK